MAQCGWAPGCPKEINAPAESSNATPIAAGRIALNRSRARRSRSQRQLRMVYRLHHGGRHSREGNRATDLFAEGSQNFHFSPRMLMRLPVLYVNNAHYPD